MNYEKVVTKLSIHENKLRNLERYQEKQNGSLQRIEAKVDKLIWAIGAGMFTIILMLVKILIDGGLLK